MKKKLAGDSVLAEFLHYVFFNIFSMVGISCYILVDTFFIGNGVGADGLTALNLAIPVFGLQQAIGFLFSVGCGTKYAILKAQGEDRHADELVTNTVISAAVVGTVFAVLINAFSRPVAVAMGATGDMIDLTAMYTKTVLTFTPAFLLNSTFNNMVKNDLNPKLSMIAMLSGSVANIVMDYIFIYPMKLGMFGAALATGMSPVVGMALLSIHIFTKKNRFHFVKTRFHISQILTVSKLGMTSAVTELASGVVVMVFNLVILSISGNIGVAAYGVIANLAIVVMAIFNGIAQGIQPIVSYNYGINNRENINKVLRYGCILTFLMAALMYVILFAFTAPIVEVFNGEHLDTLRVIAQQGVRLYFLGIFFAGFSILIAMYCNSMEKVKEAFGIAVLRGGVVMVPVLIVLVNVLHLGMPGVWLSFPISEAVILLLVLLAGARGRRQKG